MCTCTWLNTDDNVVLKNFSQLEVFDTDSCHIDTVLTSLCSDNCHLYYSAYHCIEVSGIAEVGIYIYMVKVQAHAIPFISQASVYYIVAIYSNRTVGNLLK